MSRNVRLGLMGVLVLGLTACAGKQANVEAHRPPNAKTLAGNKMAKAYGVSAQSGYQLAMASDKAKRQRNVMKAPANQTYYFDFDRSRMHDDDFKALMAQARYLASHPSARVRLEGNTDDRGSREYNIGLGWRRDQSVAKLLEQQGVSPRQIEMVSYGKERPAALGNTDWAWSLNRRVNLMYKVY